MIEYRPETKSEVAAGRIQPKALAVRIADDMIDIAATKGCAEEGDLMLRGWTPEHLREHGAQANRLAIHAVEARI